MARGLVFREGFGVGRTGFQKTLVSSFNFQLSACGWAAGWGTDNPANGLWAFDYFDAHTRGGNTENHKSVEKQM